MTRGDVLVREATAVDAESIATIHHGGWTESYRGLLPDVYLDGLSYEACLARWQAGIGGATRVFVAVGAGQVVGFVAVGRSADPDATRAGEVWDLWVRPQCRSAGVGASLLRRGLADLSGTYDAAVVWVLAGNARGRQFYARNGAVADGLTRSSPVPGGEILEVRLVFDVRGYRAQPE